MTSSHTTLSASHDRTAGLTRKNTTGARPTDTPKPSPTYPNHQSTDGAPHRDIPWPHSQTNTSSSRQSLTDSLKVACRRARQPMVRATKRRPITMLRLTAMTGGKVTHRTSSLLCQMLMQGVIGGRAIRARRMQRSRVHRSGGGYFEKAVDESMINTHKSYHHRKEPR
jgi:hypothetical protein